VSFKFREPILLLRTQSYISFSKVHHFFTTLSAATDQFAIQIRCVSGVRDYTQRRGVAEVKGRTEQIATF